MAETNLTKNKQGYGYKYTDLSQIHDYLEDNGMKYFQYIERIEGDDYVMTKRFIDGAWEDFSVRGCRVVQATLQGIKNPAQEQGSALTYARRYSLLMAFGLATEDDDAASLTTKKEAPKQEVKKEEYKCEQCGKEFTDLTTKDNVYYKASVLYSNSKKKFGKALCVDCAKNEGEQK